MMTRGRLQLDYNSLTGQICVRYHYKKDNSTWKYLEMFALQASSVKFLSLTMHTQTNIEEIGGGVTQNGIDR